MTDNINEMKKSSSPTAAANSAFAQIASGGCGSVPCPPLSAAERTSAAAPGLRSEWQPDPSPGVVTLYWGPTSQPSRAVYQMLLEAGLTHKRVDIDLRKKQQKETDYIAHINPNGLVPAIYHNGRFMRESVDILHYLASIRASTDPIPSAAFAVPSSSSSFPSTSALRHFDAAVGTPLRGTIDDWFHFSAMNVRPVLTGITRAICVARDAEQTAQLKAQIPSLMQTWETRMTTRTPPDNVYLCTSDAAGPSIADFQLFHELNGPVALGVVDLAPTPLVQSWLTKMEQRPASTQSYGNMGLYMGSVRAWLAVKWFFGSNSGTV